MSIGAAVKGLGGRAEGLFVLAVFCGAAMVFMVEPLVAKLVLPQLGGSPAVWNTSLAFFQAALLVGYGYAHLLQKLQSVRLQALVHLGVLILAAAVTLPLRVTGLFGDPAVGTPALWLMGVLTVSLGAPFAALSATAPLVQAWHARLFRRDGQASPWALYAASNLGSLLALLAYPLIVEPSLGVVQQRWGWSLAYLAFVLVMAGLALVIRRTPPAPIPADAPPAAPASWRDRLTWIGLAAIPSSLMLGVTAHLATDVASAPLLWVIPLSLYLVTFIIAFQNRPAIKPPLALILQGAVLPLCLAIFHAKQMEVVLAAHLACFFLTALVCHQALVARRPDPSRLTEFYLCLSIGGVVGGAFNAFLAPVIFDGVWEYPLVLVLSCLARPFGSGPLSVRQWLLVFGGVLFAVGAVLAVNLFDGELTAARVLIAFAAACAFMIRDRALFYLAVVAVLALSAQRVGDRIDVTASDRSFFGVVRLSRITVPQLGGEVRMMAHGTTLHGAQAQDPRFRCRPLVYYAPETVVGQVFTSVQARKPAIRVAAVGLGTGSVAAYVRPADRLTFFEIDPLVIRMSSDPKVFSYTTECAEGPVDYVLGDARLTLARQPAEAFDILLIDAFSSDAVPAHLLTVEAMRGYLSRLRPDGVIILHLSNRNLDLRSPAMAVAQAAGAHSLLQRHRAPASSPALWESSQDAVIVGKTAQSLAPWRDDPRFSASDPTRARPWTDDYTNIVGAFWRRLRERWETGR